MWYLIGAIAVGILSLSCITSTAFEFVKGKIEVLSAEFWGAIIFHLITGVLALWLAAKYAAL
ncbi:MAG: hypothetical protein V2J62_09640 [candidate division KSB1 bacterium]|jgi:hypothetical protein|nr:hypothetical protein [candidate division KSB1 bacterium]